MNPEIQEKIEKLIKTGDISELNLDKMASVSGGKADTVEIDGYEMSKEYFNDLIMSTLKSHGFHTAINVLTKMTGHQPDQWMQGKPIVGPMTDEFRMEKELDDFWERRELGI